MNPPWTALFLLQTWTDLLNQLPYPSVQRSEAHMMVLSRNLIVSGDHLPGAVFTDSIEAFDLDTETWTALPPLTDMARGGWRFAKTNIRVLRPK